MYRLQDLLHKKTFINILGYLGDLPDDLPDEKVFIGGDPNFPQKDFTRQSLGGYLGAVSSNEIAGRCLVYFVQMIINDDWSVMYHALSERLDQECSLEDLITILVDESKKTVSRHDQNQRVIIKVPPKRVITTSEKMNLWDWSRVVLYILNNPCCEAV